jgi:RNA polymerase sigma-70 factor (ECF subfamily)
VPVRWHGSTAFSADWNFLITVDSPTDQELIEQSLSGDTHAFDALVVRYQDRLVRSLQYTLGSREDALEIAQQAFVSAWRKLDSFRRDSSFYSWLFRIAMNAAISRKRRAKKSTTSLDQFVASSGAAPVDDRPTADPEYRLNSEEQVRMVQEALLQLAEEFRQPLVLKEMEDLTYEQIAEILDIPIGTVRSRIFRARQELTERLERVLKDQS